MKARIILSNADFSANNIGKYVALSDFTKKVLSKQTQYSEESDEADALNIFLNHLTEDGFIGGESPILRTLIIPGLASGHSELLYDLAQLDGNGYPTNVMSQGEADATEENRVYRPVLDAQSRVVALQRYSASSMDATTAKAQANIDNYAFRSLNADVPNNSPQNPFSVVLYIHKVNSSVFYWGNPRGTLCIYPSVMMYTGISASFGPIQKFIIGNYNKDDSRFEGSVDGTSFIGEVGTSINYQTTNNWNSYWLGNFNYSQQTELSIFMMGDYIPAEKHVALKGYVETFLTAIHANI